MSWLRSMLIIVLMCMFFRYLVFMLIDLFYSICGSKSPARITNRYWWMRDACIHYYIYNRFFFTSCCTSQKYKNYNPDCWYATLLLCFTGSKAIKQPLKSEDLLSVTVATYMLFDTTSLIATTKTFTLLSNLT